MNELVKLKSSIIELPFAVVTFRKEGYIHIHYKYYCLTLEDCKTLFRVIHKNSPWEKCPVLITQHELATEDKEAREYNLRQHLTKNCTAIAFVLNNLAQRLVFNFYKRIFQSNRPSKCFSNVDLAIEWLKPFTSQNRDSKD